MNGLWHHFTDIVSRRVNFMILRRCLEHVEALILNGEIGRVYGKLLLVLELLELILQVDVREALVVVHVDGHPAFVDALLGPGRL